MHSKLVIIGAGGHGKVVSDIAKSMQTYDEIVFVDDELANQCNGLSIVGKCADAEKYIEDSEIFVAIGNAKYRKEITEQLETVGASMATLVHPTAVLGSNVKVESGTVIMAGAVVNADSKIGKGSIINTCSSVDHDCCLENYVHVAVGAHLCGTVQVGNGTWIGAGATVSNNISISGDCTIGAGAVVVKDILEPGTYVGVPAKKIKE